MLGPYPSAISDSKLEGKNIIISYDHNMVHNDGMVCVRDRSCVPAWTCTVRIQAIRATGVEKIRTNPSRVKKVAIGTIVWRRYGWDNSIAPAVTAVRIAICLAWRFREGVENAKHAHA